jgi:hypothetical protein
VARRQQLACAENPFWEACSAGAQAATEAQISELFDPPSDRRELVRHYTLADLTSRRSGDAVAITTASVML